MEFVELPALKSGDVSFSKQSIDPGHFDYQHSSSITTMLIIKQNNLYSGYTMTIFADSSYLKGDFDKLKRNTYRNRDKDFTGLVLYHKLDGTFVNGWQYNNGAVINPIYEKAVTASASGPSVQNVKINKQVCSATQITTYWSNCQYSNSDLNMEHPSNCYYYETQNIYTTCAEDGSGGGNGGGDPTPPICPPTTPPGDGGTVEESIKNRTPKVQTYQPPATPIDPIGPITPPTDPGNPPCIVPQILPTDTIKINPCAKKNQIIANAQIAALASENTAVYNTLALLDGKEYGAEQNLTSLPSNLSRAFTGTNYMNVPVRASSSTTSTSSRFNANFAWDATNGFTLGVTHSHPAGSAPSPLDVVALVAAGSRSALRSAGQSSINFFRANASLTAITEDYKYIITINDWSGLSAQLTGVSDEDLVSQFQNLLRNNNNSSEVALLKMFGNQISLFRARQGFNDFTPVQLDNENGTTILTQCP